MFSKSKAVISRFFKSLSRNKKINTYALFFFFSFAFWFLTMLSKIHETTLEIPVHYINCPADLVAVVEPSDFVEVRVKAAGISFFAFYFFNYNALVLNYDLAKSKPIPGGKSLFWIMNSMRKEVSDVLGASIEIIDVKPERLIVPFSKKTYKEVPVILNANIDLKQSYWLANDIKLSPSFITLYGEQSLLDSINSVTTNFINLNNIDKNQKHEMTLVIPEGLNSKIFSVFAEINVEPFVEEIVKRKVEIRNLNPSFSMKIFPSTVSVSLRLPKDKYHLVKTDILRLYVDASDIREQRTIPIQFDKLPNSVKIERIYPNHLEFLLIKE